MLHRRSIAVVIAGLLVGAQAGIAAISLPESESEEYAEASYAEPAPVVAESAEAAAPEAEPVEQAASAVEEAAPARDAVVSAAPDTQAAFVPSTVFPSSADDVSILPALAAYLDRKAATQLTGAPGPVFPSSADEWRLLPAVIAYFDRLEATRLAAREQAVAQNEISLPAAAEQHVKLLPTQPATSDQEIARNPDPAANGAAPYAGS